MIYESSKEWSNSYLWLLSFLLGLREQMNTDQNKTKLVRTPLKLQIHALRLQGFSNWISHRNYVRKGGWDFAKVNNPNRDVKRKKEKCSRHTTAWRIVENSSHLARGLFKQVVKPESILHLVKELIASKDVVIFPTDYTFKYYNKGIKNTKQRTSAMTWLRRGFNSQGYSNTTLPSWRTLRTPIHPTASQNLKN